MWKLLAYLLPRKSTSLFLWVCSGMLVMGSPGEGRRLVPRSSDVTACTPAHTFSMWAWLSSWGVPSGGGGWLITPNSCIQRSSNWWRLSQPMGLHLCMSSCKIYKQHVIGSWYEDIRICKHTITLMISLNTCIQSFSCVNLKWFTHAQNVHAICIVYTKMPTN